MDFATSVRRSEAMFNPWYAGSLSARFRPWEPSLYDGPKGFTLFVPAFLLFSCIPAFYYNMRKGFRQSAARLIFVEGSAIMGPNEEGRGIGTMKKKIGFAFLAVAAAALLIAGYFQFLAPKAQSGAKSVTIRVVMQSKGIDKTFHYQTTRSYVAELLKDKQRELKAVTKKSQYGDFVSGLLGVTADASKEYFNIKVDGKDASVGISQLPLESGKTYTFTLTAL